MAWLSLDAGDNDPARLWRHVLAALDQVYPGLSGRLGRLRPPRPRSFDGLVTALVNDDNAQSPDGALVLLDDYHVIGPEPVYPHEPGHLVLARVLLARVSLIKRAARLDRLHVAALNQQRVDNVIEVQALRALALVASGQDRAAVVAPCPHDGPGNGSPGGQRTRVGRSRAAALGIPA